MLCSSDPEYLPFAQEVCAAVRVPVLVAGNPRDQAKRSWRLVFRGSCTSAATSCRRSPSGRMRSGSGSRRGERVIMRDRTSSQIVAQFSRPAVGPITPTGPARGDGRLTPEHIPVKAVYSPGDLEGMEHLEYAAGLPPFLRGPVRHDVRAAAVDDSAVRGLLDGRRVERLLPPQPRGGAERPVGGLRSRDAPRLRLRQRARRRRRRQGGRGDRFGRGHEDPLRSDPARPDVRVDDDERGRAAGDGVLHRRGGGAGGDGRRS